MQAYMIDKDHKRELREYNLNDITNKFNQNLFYKVAEVTGDTLEDAYRLLQNVDHSWVQNKDVVSWARDTAYTRSLSVGDVVKKDGVYYAVAGCGFNELEGILHFNDR